MRLDTVHTADMIETGNNYNVERAGSSLVVVVVEKMLVDMI